MEFNQFVAIMEDIESHSGDKKNMSFFFDLTDGNRWEAHWEWLKKEKTSHGVIVLSPVGDHPPIYMPVGMVAYVSIRNGK